MNRDSILYCIAIPYCKTTYLKLSMLPNINSIVPAKKTWAQDSDSEEEDEEEIEEQPQPSNDAGIYEYVSK